ncbi:MAG: BamA/TamA family outer membrane protein [Proteobacteria bacterium]|nr:BamA/TamA family outer membrane protein [Pseudomonadota bacterium]
MTATRRKASCLLAALTTSICLGAHSEEENTSSQQPPEDQGVMAQHARSPWLFVPLVSTGPKLGTSLGAMAGYIHRFDAQSPPSMLAVQGKGSNTGSSTVAAGGKLYFNEDRDRVIVGIADGKATNDYLDFLGTGQQVRDDEQIRGYFLRYQHRVAPHLYLGAQALRSNYGVDGVDVLSDQILDQAGITGVDAAGMGLALTYDSRDNQHNPADGTLAQLYNVAYRESLGGDVSYDVYNADWRKYVRTGENNVVALHATGHWTQDAPASREATVQIRGYTRGQYLGKNSLTFEAENRYMFRPQWGAKVFAGATCLYGDGKSCNGDNLYPMAGLGAFYIIKPKENMLVSMEYAKGSGDNQGFYIRFGHSF